MSSPVALLSGTTLADTGARSPTAPLSSPRTIRAALPIFARHGSPRIITTAVVLSLAMRLELGSWSLWDLLAIAALLVVWPVQEWLIHVCILHFKPVTLWGRTFEFRIPRTHRAHHRDPWDAEILFIPLHAYLYIFTIDVLLWRAVTPTATLAMTGVSFSLALTLHYEWIHFLIHTRVAPRTRYYQRLWRNHRLHHFKNEHYWYGVTRLEGDRLLGTAPSANAVVLSPTARSLASTNW